MDNVEIFDSCFRMFLDCRDIAHRALRSRCTRPGDELAESFVRDFKLAALDALEASPRALELFVTKFATIRSADEAISPSFHSPACQKIKRLIGGKLRASGVWPIKPYFRGVAKDGTGTGVELRPLACVEKLYG